MLFLLDKKRILELTKFFYIAYFKSLILLFASGSLLLILGVNFETSLILSIFISSISFITLYIKNTGILFKVINLKKYNIFNLFSLIHIPEMIREIARVEVSTSKFPSLSTVRMSFPYLLCIFLLLLLFSDKIHHIWDILKIIFHISK